MQKKSSVQQVLTSMNYPSDCRVTLVFKISKDALAKAVQIHVALQISPTQILGFAHLHHTSSKCPKSKSVLIIRSSYLGLFFLLQFGWKKVSANWVKQENLGNAWLKKW